MANQPNHRFVALQKTHMFEQIKDLKLNFQLQALGAARMHTKEHTAYE